MINILYHVANIHLLMSVLIVIFLIVRKYFLNTRYAKLTLFIYAVFFIRLLIPYNIHTDFRDTSTETINLAGPVLNYQSWVNQGLIRLEEVDLNLINTGAQQAVQRGVSIVDLILIAWILGIFIFLATIFKKHFSFHRKLMLVVDPNTDTHVKTVVDEISNELHIRKPIDVYLSYNIPPMVIGMIRPKIIIPRSCYASAALYWTVYHEMVHIKRHDAIYQLIAVIANAIYWTNPLVHRLRRLFEIDLECACDERVWKNRTKQERYEYLDTIADLMNEEMKALSPFSSGLISDRKILNYRYTRGIIELKPNGALQLGIGAAIIMVVASMLTNPFSRDVLPDRDLTIARSASITQTYSETNEDIASFATMFINEFTSSVYNRTDMDFENYIRNENLLGYANKMQELTILQEENEMGAIPFGETNKWLETSVGILANHLYVVSIQYENNGVGISTYFIVSYETDRLWIDDFYFGIPNGIEYLLTGSADGRNVINAERWNDSSIVSSVMDALNAYEQELRNAN